MKEKIYLLNISTFVMIVMFFSCLSSCSDDDEDVDKEIKSYSSCPDNHHPHLIDLNLPSGTLWSCCNVDDEHHKQSPTNYGSYYSWGETESKAKYDLSSYILFDQSSGTYHDLGSDIAGTQYDVAHVKWGGSWVMPSWTQLTELINNCTYEWTTENGVNGAKFTSKKNGASIFLPATGYRNESDLYEASSTGFYWTSTQGPTIYTYADSFYFSSDGIHNSGSSFGFGYTVRPVISN